MQLTRRQWSVAAGWISVAWVIVTAVTVASSLTIGLITGLVVLMVPAYLLLTWVCLIAVAVCLAQWRGHRAVARTAAVAAGPAARCAGGRCVRGARIGCGREPDPTSCLAYLDGSPLLLLLVIVVALAGVLAVVAAWLVTGPARWSAGRRAVPVAPG